MEGQLVSTKTVLAMSNIFQLLIQAQSKTSTAVLRIAIPLLALQPQPERFTLTLSNSHWNPTFRYPKHNPIIPKHRIRSQRRPAGCQGRIGFGLVRRRSRPKSRLRQPHRDRLDLRVQQRADPTAAAHDEQPWTARSTQNRCGREPDLVDSGRDWAGCRRYCSWD